MEYWCQDENEKKRLREIYARNEQKYNELLQITFNPNDVFKSKQQVKENIPVVRKQESKVKRIINKIKRLFFR